MSAAQPERRDFDLWSPCARPAAPSRRPSFAPQAGPPPARPVPAPVEKVLFEPDAPAAPDKASFTARTEELLKRLADLLRRPDAPTPFAIGLFAPAGGGKSSAIGWLTEILAAAGAPIVALRAADLAEEPERALAAALYRALRRAMVRSRRKRRWRRPISAPTPARSPAPRATDFTPCAAS